MAGVLYKAVVEALISGLEKVSKGHVKAVNNVDHVKSWKCSLAMKFLPLWFAFFF